MGPRDSNYILQVPPEGFEPSISELRTRRPWPLDDGGMVVTFYVLGGQAYPATPESGLEAPKPRYDFGDRRFF